MDSVLEIEEHALQAWPAAEVEACAGWELRAMGGVSRRANSVWTSRATGLLSVAERIAHAEAFYRARELPVSFQVTTHSGPPELDTALAELGYRIESPVSVRAALALEVASAETCLGVRTEVSTRLSDTWFDLSARRGRFANVQETYRGLLGRIGSRALFALAIIDECPAAVGLGVLGARWLGVSSMFTLPSYRRRGAARSLLVALAGHAPAPEEPGKPTIYLQVERDNPAALALYSGIGFHHHHAYHYRLEPAPNVYA